MVVVVGGGGEGRGGGVEVFYEELFCISFKLIGRGKK